MYKLRPFVTSKILCDIYYAIIYPFLLYGIMIWGNTSLTLLNPIHMLQKKFVRMATYKDGYPLLPGPLSHTPPLFHKLGFLNIFDIFKLQLGKLVFESTNGIGPSNNVLKFIRISETHCHNTRYADQGNLYINSVRTTRFGLKGLQFEGAKLWTAISTKIAKLRSHSFLDLKNIC